jgi:hypothetical protein
MVQLGPRQALPDWATGPSEFCSVTRTRTELSIIAPLDALPPGTAHDGEWACLGIDQKFTLDVPGIAASVTAPLAAAGLSVFVVATVDTDYFLVRDATAAARRTVAAGHDVVLPDDQAS